MEGIHISNEELVIQLQQILKSLHSEIDAYKQKHQSEVRTLKETIEQKDKEISQLKNQMSLKQHTNNASNIEKQTSNKSLKRISLHRLDSTKINSFRCKPNKSEIYVPSDLNSTKPFEFKPIREDTNEDVSRCVSNEKQGTRFEQLASLSKGLLLSVRKSLEKYNDVKIQGKGLAEITNFFQLENRKAQYVSEEIKRDRQFSHNKAYQNQSKINLNKKKEQKQPKKKQNKENQYENKRVIDVLIPVKKISFLTASLKV